MGRRSKKSLGLKTKQRYGFLKAKMRETRACQTGPTFLPSQIIYLKNKKLEIWTKPFDVPEETGIL